MGVSERVDDFNLAVTALLRSRREARARVQQIEMALSALGVDRARLDAEDSDPAATEGPVDDVVHGRLVGRLSRRELPSRETDRGDAEPESDPSPLIRWTPSVRSAVQQVLDAEDRWFATADLADAIKDRVPDRGANKLKANIRSSLWSLRKSNLVVARDNTYRSAQWETDADAASVSSEAASETSPDQ